MKDQEDEEDEEDEEEETWIACLQWNEETLFPEDNLLFIKTLFSNKNFRTGLSRITL